MLIHRSERASYLRMPRGGGRRPDDPVAWYCHFRLHEKLSKGVLQSRIAHEARLPGSAVNLLVRDAKGAGPDTAKRIARYLGFETRGAMVDAADAWWSTPEASQYVAEALRRRAAERIGDLKKRYEAQKSAPGKPSRRNPAEKRKKTGS